MKSSFYASLLLAALLMMHTACAVSSQPPTQKVQRVPLEKSDVVLKSPTEYDKDELEDPQTGKVTSYDLKPRVELIDAKAGKYAFKWIGVDGKEKVVTYQRADAIDAVVSASVRRTAEGQYLYTYKVENLPSSAVHLSGFIPQNFAADTKPIEIDGKPTNVADLRLLKAFREVPPNGSRRIEGLFIGEMSNQIQRFKDGNWIDFAILPDDNNLRVVPGRSLEVKLVSAAPPGLVGCSVYGGDGLGEGAGEDMPQELANVLPGYAVLPAGYTIGPVAKLSTLSASEHARHVLALLPHLRALGWMTDDALRRYEQALQRNDLESLRKRAQQDLQAEQITSEVAALVQAINPQH